MNQPINIFKIFIFQLSIRQVDLYLWFLWSHYGLFDITPGSRTTPREPSLCSHLTPSRRMFGNTHGSTIGATSATVMGLWTQAFSWPKNTLDLEGWDNCCSLEVTICLSEVGDWWWLFIVGRYLQIQGADLDKGLHALRIYCRGIGGLYALLRDLAVHAIDFWIQGTLLEKPMTDATISLSVARCFSPLSSHAAGGKVSLASFASAMRVAMV